MESCIVEGCSGEAHARGFCSTHYGQIWRHGRITAAQAGEPFSLNMMESDRIRARIISTEREIKKAVNIYNLAIGLTNRLKWRKEIKSLEDDVLRLTALLKQEETSK